MYQPWDSKTCYKSLALAAKSWMTEAIKKKPVASKNKLVGRLWVIFDAKSPALKKVKSELSSFQYEKLTSAKEPLYRATTAKGLVTVAKLWIEGKPKSLGADPLEACPYGRAREAAGVAIKDFLEQKVDHVEIIFAESSTETVGGALVGLEMGAYSFLKVMKAVRGLEAQKWPSVSLHGVPKKILNEDFKRYCSLGVSVNLARHLTNLPGHDLNPKSYADYLGQFFKRAYGVKVEVWQQPRLLKEKMGLLVAVGAGSNHPSCLVKLRYRPRGTKGAPLAFVGKGITFDSGGLDIKPAQGMRFMKKDMGGSAALVVGLCHFLSDCQIPQPCDFYLAISENAISEQSFRPGDILQSRKGDTVEIHNTDAEGRLALADALDLSIKQKPQPRAVIDVATLTGAIKMGLGADIAGLFANNDGLAEDLSQAAHKMGEPAWRMPLFQSYRPLLKSSVAEMANSADGFGGAITAALFLEAFVGQVPWAHFDIYAWKDSPQGALTEMGGSGQMVQTLAEYVGRIAEGWDRL